MEVEGKLVDSFRSSNADDGFSDNCLLLFRGDDVDDDEYLNKGYESGVTVNRSMANTASKVTFGTICFGVLLPKRSSITWNFILEARRENEKGVGREWRSFAYINILCL